MKKLLWLDDKRNPFENEWISCYSPIGSQVDIIWVKDYFEFVGYITENGLPDAICFDHDLACFIDEKEYTGMDCANWIVNYCLDNNLKIPPYSIQSDNPSSKNIDYLFKNFNKFFGY